MPVLSCSGCGQKLQVPDRAAGQKVKCPRCALVQPVPAAPAPATAAGARIDPSLAAEPTVSQELPSPLQPSLAGDQAETRADEHGLGKRLSLRAGGENPFPFLGPPEGPNELGRLGGYIVLKKLGAGGMGVVFRAQDPKLARPVALKAMLPSTATGAAAHDRFLLEARATAALKHDHIVRIYQVAEDRGVPFLAMEFLEGETLDECLKRERRLPTSEVLRIGREIASGLAAAHAAGLLHRDIKPGNVWLESETRRVKILDFGLARSLGGDTQLTQVGGVVGTPLYMAPEQAQGAPVDQRCDLFSLGCVLYRMCTGHLPFKGANTMAILRAVAVEQPTPPVQLSPDVPAALSDLILRLLAKDRTDRPGSAVEVIRAITAIERGGAVSAAPPPGPPPVVSIRPASEPLPPTVALTPAGREWWRRRPVWIAAAAGLMLFLAAPVVLTVLFSGGNGPAAPGKNDPSSGGRDHDAHAAGPGAKGDHKTPPLALVPPEPPGPELVRRFVGHTAPIRAVAFTPTGESFYALSGSELWLWDVDKDTEERRFSATVPVSGSWNAMAFSPVQKKVLLSGSAVGFKNLLLLWDLQDDQQIVSWQGGDKPDNSLALSPDQHKVLSSDQANVTRLWDVDAGKRLFPLEGGQSFFTPDGRQIVTAKLNYLMVWDADSGQEIHRFEIPGNGNIVQLAPFSDGRRVVLSIADSANAATAQVWDFQKGEQLQLLQGHTSLITALAVSADGRRVLTGSADQTVRWWDADTGKELHCFKDHIGAVRTVAISPGGRRALSGGDDQTIRMWSLPE